MTAFMLFSTLDICIHLVTLTVYFSNGCATSEDIFWKLDALQNFVRDLHWPDPEFANHLNQRLKAMAADMIESSIHRSVFNMLRI